MAISCSIINPKLSRFFAMIDPRQAAFAWQRIDSFCEGMMELLMNLNQYRAATFKSFFSI